MSFISSVYTDSFSLSWNVLTLLFLWWTKILHTYLTFRANPAAITFCQLTAYDSTVQAECCMTNAFFSFLLVFSLPLHFALCLLLPNLWLNIYNKVTEFFHNLKYRNHVICNQSMPCLPSLYLWWLLYHLSISKSDKIQMTWMQLTCTFVIWKKRWEQSGKNTEISLCCTNTRCINPYIRHQNLIHT